VPAKVARLLLVVCSGDVAAVVTTGDLPAPLVPSSGPNGFDLVLKVGLRIVLSDDHVGSCGTGRCARPWLSNGLVVGRAVTVACL